jgi:hypothetical protein
MNLDHEFNHLPRAAIFLHWGIERVLRPEGWQLESIRGGWNSFYLYKPGDKRQFHFRWWPSHGNQIAVFDRYYLGTRLGDISENNVIRFVAAVKKGRRWL